MKIKNLTTQKLFAIVSFVGIVLNIMVLLITGGNHWNSIFVQGGNSFDDLTRPLSAFFTYDNVYEGGVDMCFPPLAYEIYGLLAHTMRVFGFDTQASIISNPTGLLIGALFITITLCITVISFMECVEATGVERIVLTLSVALSFPVIIAFNQGSAVLIVTPLLIGALALRNSKKKWCRELSLFFVAIAAGIKIYPAILGLLWVKEKRWSEVVRLVIYGVMFFFGPFIFFGGFEGISLWISNVTALNGFESVSRFQSPDIAGMVMFILGRFIGAEQAFGIGKMFSLAYFACVIIIFFLHKLDWKSITLLFSLMVVFVSPSHSYTYVYFCAILLQFFLETKNHELTKMNGIYAILWSVIFTAWPLGNLRAYMMILAVYGILILTMVSCVTDIIKMKHK